MFTRRHGTRMFTSRGSLSAIAVAAVVALWTCTAVQACPPAPPPPGPTEWVAGIDDWFIDANWDDGVPTPGRLALINNWGEANVATACAQAGQLELGVGPDDGGAVNIWTDGSLRVYGDERIGREGYGTLHQADGRHAVYGELVLAEAATGYGTALLDGGRLSVRRGETLGLGGSGSFLQSAGLHEISCGSLVLGREAGSDGAYSLYGGQLDVRCDEVVGCGGTGSFYQADGEHRVRCGNLVLARRDTAFGAYALDGGTLCVGRSEVVGGAGTGTLDQFGGEHRVAHCLTVGLAPDSVGTFTLGGGTLDVGGNEFIGKFGTGIVGQVGGVHTVNGLLVIGASTEGLGMLAIDGGSLTAGALYVGMSGEAYLDLNAGAEVEATCRLVFGPKACLTAVPGAAILLTGTSVVNYSTDEVALAGLKDLELILDNTRWSCRWKTVEVSGTDLGATPAGFVDNFALGTLTVGADQPTRVALVDRVDNGNRASPEALYAHNVTVSPGSVLRLCGVNLYVDGVIDVQGQVIGGAIVPVP